MRFLDTDIQINSKTFYTLIPSPITAGLLCLVGGISYCSWNYYKNKKQEVKVKPIQKEDLKKEINSIQTEKLTIITNAIKPVQENASEATEKDKSDMLNDAENKFKTVVNDDSNWVIIRIPYSSSNQSNCNKS